MSKSKTYSTASILFRALASRRYPQFTLFSARRNIGFRHGSILYININTPEPDSLFK